MAQGTTKGVPIDIDPTLAANSDLLVPSQKAVKTYAQSKLNGTGFVKANGTSITYDNNTYLTASNAVTSISFGTTGLTPNTSIPGSITVSGTLNVANGGTGATSLTGILLGNTTSSVTGISGTASGQVLWYNGSTYSFITFATLPKFSEDAAGLVPSALGTGASPYIFLASNGTWQKIVQFYTGGSREGT